LGEGDKKKGAAEVWRLGWATQQECSRLDESFNFGNEYYLGAHSPLERRSIQNQDRMSLVMAAEFVRKLLARWLTSKIGGSKMTGI
jgi:hypothetical protein